MLLLIESERKKMSIMHSITGRLFHCEGAIRFQSDDRSLFLDSVARVNDNATDADQESALRLLGTLLQSVTPDLSEISPAPIKRGDDSFSNSVSNPHFNSPPGVSTPGDVTASQQSSRRGVVEVETPKGSVPSGFSRTPEKKNESIKRLPKCVQNVICPTFDPNFTQLQCIHVSDDGRSARRFVSGAVSGISLVKELLTAGSRIDFEISELNLHLRGSGWVGVTEVRHFSTLSEYAIYLDLASGEIYRNGVCIESAAEIVKDSENGIHFSRKELQIGEGDVISIEIDYNSQLTFLWNNHRVCAPLQNVPKLAYPFVNVYGKIVRVRLR
eukprot:GHVL01009156.1.p1 GENE.GHVL01009156.1~~GHVL01009156.1.p1  ORF type:complete len:328 (+),score=53.77 GHVL01009156.1:809-1792(+)